MYLKQISRLSSSQGELATILVYPGYLPIFFAIFTFCSEVFAFMDLPFLPSPVPSCQILFRSLRVFLSVWWRHMYVISQPNFFIVFGRRLHKLEKLVSDPYLLFLANQNMLKLKPQKYTSRWKWWCVMSMKLLSYVNVYVKIQMYMSRYKCICQGTNVYVKVQMYMSRYKYICQGTNVYVKVQMYMSRYKCICQGTSVYVKVQMYMSRYKCICCVIKQMYHSRTGYLQKFQSCDRISLAVPAQFNLTVSWLLFFTNTPPDSDISMFASQKMFCKLSSVVWLFMVELLTITV